MPFCVNPDLLPLDIMSRPVCNSDLSKSVASNLDAKRRDETFIVHKIVFATNDLENGSQRG